MSRLILFCKKVKSFVDYVTDIFAYLGVFIGMLSLLPILGIWGLVILFLLVVIFILRLTINWIIKFLNESRTSQHYNLKKTHRYKLLKITEILFSAKTQKEVFEVTMADWDEEIYETLKNEKDAKLFMIHMRNTYAFLMAMWIKSPIGDLIEFVRKIAS